MGQNTRFTGPFHFDLIEVGRVLREMYFTIQIFLFQISTYSQIPQFPNFSPENLARICELRASCVALVVSDVSVHEAP